ncbi:hypothetical protein GCM10023115_18210 [Pontixanthobacter gangjinensis]|uniref:Phage holin family protein n=1 Tax=Pontixanthobacter gangjinensis TaxID=1028742 RepID=A0A6I4SN13_9SPHN|nr:phage holin family protein [Pontixanthobacter gangjinensis]MXO57069.1 phage holin family protein [Pontixanthobacter gangjinensis]
MQNTDLPDRQDDNNVELDNLDPPPVRSLTDDINALVDDGKTYVEAELAFQKTRLALVANRSKSGIGLVLAALAFLHLALIGLVVGGIVALIPVMGPVGAMLVVVGILLIGMAGFLFAARGKFSSVSAAFKDEG